MTKIEKNRLILREGESIHLSISLGSTYISWIKSAPSRAVAHYIFSYIFEQSQISGESGVHKHIKALDFGDHNFGNESEPVYNITANLDISLDEYNRLRRTTETPDGKHRNHFPSTKVLDI